MRDTAVKNENLLTVHQQLCKNLKYHQREGVKFIWNCFSKDVRCILTHCMGLGKKLQVATLSHTVLINSVGEVFEIVPC